MLQKYVFFCIYPKKAVILQRFSQNYTKNNINHLLKKRFIMKKVLFVAAIAMCVMGCTKKAENNTAEAQEEAAVEVVEEAPVQEEAPVEVVEEAAAETVAE